MNWSSFETLSRFRLGDPSSKIWATDELKRYLREGQGALTDSQAFLKRAGWNLVSGTRSYTLPSDCFEVRGVKYNGKRLNGISNQRLEELDSQYLTATGTPEFYYLEDVQTISLYPIPSLTADYTTFDSEYGVLISWAEDSTYFSMNSDWGVLIEAFDVTTGTFVGVEDDFGVAISGDSGGGILEVRYAYDPSDDAGAPSTVGPGFIEDAQLFYVMQKALEREGPGQNLRLAGFFQMRFERALMAWRAKNLSVVHGQDQWVTQRPSSWGLDRMWRERTWR